MRFDDYNNVSTCNYVYQYIYMYTYAHICVSIRVHIQAHMRVRIWFIVLLLFGVVVFMVLPMLVSVVIGCFSFFVCFCCCLHLLSLVVLSVFISNYTYLHIFTSYVNADSYLQICVRMSTYTAFF